MRTYKLHEDSDDEEDGAGGEPARGLDVGPVEGDQTVQDHDDHPEQNHVHAVPVGVPAHGVHNVYSYR